MSLSLQLRDYRLTTANILYHRPDHPALLQTFLWQEMDIAPEFPVLHRFLRFWEDNLDGRLHSVQVASCDVITPGDLRWVDVPLSVH